VSHARQLAPYVPGVLYHHEMYNGNGYPEGLQGEHIPLDARIMGVADAFAAMTSDRSYSDALTLPLALEEIKQGAGTQFDGEVVEAFISLCEKGKLGNKHDTAIFDTARNESKST